MADDQVATHADGRLRIRAQAGSLQYDPGLVVRMCPECSKPGVLSGGGHPAASAPACPCRGS